MKKSTLSKCIDKLYENRQKFIIIGLTGRTGSGCTTALDILGSDIDEIKPPVPCNDGSNEERKYQIVYDFLKQNWKKFHKISIRNVITSFILEAPFDDFVKYSTQKINKLRKVQKSKEEVVDLLGSRIESEYNKLHQLRLNLIKKREEIESSDIKSGADIEKLREDLYDFYFNKVPSFAKLFKDKLGQLSGDAYISLYQIFGNNIRSSGSAINESFDPSNINRISIRVNKIIKVLRGKYTKKEGKEVFVAIDALRNPFEVLFFRERYAAFYLIAINTPNEDRTKRLIKKLNINEQQLKYIDREWDKSLEGEEIFYSQDIKKCVELADIHINNPQKSEDDFSIIKKQLLRYIALIMHPGLIPPSREERCMQVAYSARLNSGCLSRQVGAAITDANYSIKAIGWNSSAQGQPPCILRSVKDLLSNEDESAYSFYEKNNLIFRKAMHDLYDDALEKKDCKEKLKGRNISYCFKDIKNILDNDKNQVHTRSLHAEENAFLQLVKYGSSGIDGGILFTTASPCELCSKKAYQLGIRKIIFIDPYPGIAKDHILNVGNNPPELVLFHGAIGRAYNQLYEPILPYKDELRMILEG